MQPLIAGNLDSRASARGITRAERRVIIAASLGTVLELYDFFVVGLLANELAKAFFSGINPAAAYIFTLLGFAAGFVLRPFGALAFGRIGDLFGRKRTFLVTIVMMGACTFGIGLIPGYPIVGIAAPMLFIGMRLLQGLALGGEFSGAVIYVAEHAPARARGAWTSWIILTAALGLLLSFAVVLPLRVLVGKDAFVDWGWRIPFLVSSILLAISVWVRLKLDESPEFARMKAAGTLSKAPIAETFGQWKHLKLVLIAFFGMVAGQAVVWYTGQFYTMFFLTKVLKVDDASANLLVIGATVATAPLYFFFGWLSDRIGRKPVFLSGLLLAALCFLPLFRMMSHYANPALERAQQQAPVVVVADISQCALQFNPTGTATYSSSCDVVKATLGKAGLSYTTVPGPSGAVAQVRIGADRIIGYDARVSDAHVQSRLFDNALRAALSRNGYPEGTADLAAMNMPMLFLLLVISLSFGTMTFAPSSAMLVEHFPSRIRYTAMSFPYHLGSAIFGGFLPAAAFAIVAATGDIFSGLRYPVTVASMAFVVTLFLAKESRGKPIADASPVQASQSR
ncbi:MFS transporter [Paraburkholderia ginsengiterrae]|uniref:MFS transporter n=1 Tax=Paraburkholderia ginsengiterrae TaxID=1462993 RepID=UPI000AA09025|nr:MFS transporter [Paraburkholderia ginsengiterrae]